MDLAQRTEEFLPGEDQTWLGSAHGTTTAEPMTLDNDSFLAIFTDGVVPSGVFVAKFTAAGPLQNLYVPYDNAADAGEGDVAAGLTFTTKKLGAAGGKTGAARFWHGQVISANLPTNHGGGAAAVADLKQIDFIGTPA